MLWWTLRKLRSLDPGTRGRAAEELGDTKDTQAVLALIRIVWDENLWVRSEAVKSLGKIGNPLAVEPLLAVMKSKPMSDLERYAANALANIGDMRAFGSLVEIIPRMQSSREKEEPLIRLLAKISDTHDISMIDQLEAALTKTLGYEMPQKLLAETLVHLGWKPTNDVQSVAFAIAQKNWQELIRIDELATEPLGSIALNQYLDSNLRKASIETLGKIRHPKAIKPLISLLGPPYNHQLIEDALKALSEYSGHSTVKPLTTAFVESFGQSSHSNILRALEQTGWKPEDVSQRVLHAIDHGNWNDVVDYHEASINPLIILLKSRDNDLKEKAAKALGEIGNTIAVEPLIETLRTRDAGVRWAVARALGKIGDDRAIYPLLDSLYNYHGRSGPQGEADALGEIGNEKAVIPLVDLALREPESASLAINSLKRVMGRVIEKIQDKDLHTVAQLVQISYKLEFIQTGDCFEGQVDCSFVKELAQKELTRRQSAT